MDTEDEAKHPIYSVEQRNELLHRFVSELSEFAIVLIDTDGIFATWNPAVESQFGYTAKEFIGQRFELLFPLQERIRGTARRELDRALEAGKASDTRWLVKKNGQRILVEGLTIGLRDQVGTHVGFGKIFRDITERRNAEHSLESIAKALDQSTVLVRRWDGTIDHWTAGCEKLYGWTAREAEGQVAHELLKTRFPFPLDQVQQQLLLAGTWKGEMENARRDGTPVMISAQWVLPRDRPDEPLTVIETMTDITDRLRMQKELEAANGRLLRMAVELERSNRELEEFARITSHDLSAPITSTRWLVDLLSSRNVTQLDENGRECLKQIAHSLDHMAELIEGVLAHAKVGRTAIGALEPADAEKSLAIAIGNLRRDIETSGTVISHDVLPGVQIEPQALTQLFQNLLSNAIKYHRRGSPPIVRISVERAGSMWRFGVRDNGIGIAPQYFERIFQPLQRLHRHEIAGSGIGLATCRKIVDRAGGKIWVESKMDVGSTFFFTLPGPERDNSEPPL